MGAAGQEGGGYRAKEEVDSAAVEAFAVWLSEASEGANDGRDMADVLTLHLKDLPLTAGEPSQPIIAAVAAAAAKEGAVLHRLPKEPLALLLPGGSRQPLPQSVADVSLALESAIAAAEAELSMRLLPDQRALLSLLLLLHRHSTGQGEVGGVHPDQWAHWIRILPHTFPTPFYWNKEEISTIKGTQLYATTKQAKTLVKEDNNDILRPLREASPELFPKERYNSASLKWAKAVWRSRVTSCTVPGEDGGEPLEFECFHPIYELANYGQAATVQIREADGFLELVALADIAPGDELIIGDDSALSDLQLLDYYGYLREEGHQEHSYGFGVGLDSSESMYGWKKELLASKHLQDHQLYALKAMELPPKELLYALRVYFMTIYESDELGALFNMEPLSLNNELEVFSAIGSTCLRKLQKFSTTLASQKEELQDVSSQLQLLRESSTEAVGRAQLATLERKERGLAYAIAEREILLYHERYAAHMVEEVRAAWDTRSFDVPTNQQVIL